jgi:hypothetical protein
MEEIIDRDGNRIYMTEERWMHILDRHEEMLGLKDKVIKTLRTVRRKVEPLDPTISTYSKFYKDLPDLYNMLVVVVKFETINDKTNNFVLTAFLIYKRAGGRYDRKY